MHVRNAMPVELGRLQLLGLGRNDYLILEGTTTRSGGRLHLFFANLLLGWRYSSCFVVSFLVHNLIASSQMSRSSIADGMVSDPVNF